LALGARAVWQLASAAIANATIERRAMLACALLVWLVGVRDYCLRVGILGDETASAAYLPYTVSVVLLTFGSLILFRFARALRETEVLNRELEARVEQKAAELEANYARIRVFERDQALVAERARIMRDMHDGIGGQLVAAIALASRPESSRELDGLLHEALDDLRMMIDSLESSEADLLTALGMLRMRVTNRFAAAGLEFRWEVTDVPRIPGFGSEQVLQLMRIVQEAFANTLKHAGARTITVRTSSASMSDGRSAVCVAIEDDGRGIANAERMGGRGLANMRRRAQSLGAEIEITPGPERGTRVSVRLPLSGLAST
jgi:signal transduction histidine kinase